MIAKLIAYGPSRDAAIDRLIAALDATVVEGIQTNRAFLARLLDHPEFRSGNITTDFAMSPAEAESHSSPWTAYRRFRLNQPYVRELEFASSAEERTRLRVTVKSGAVIVDGLDRPYTAEARWIDSQLFEARFAETTEKAVVILRRDAVELRWRGQTFTLARTRTGRGDAQPSHGARTVVTPMPGRVISVDVSEGARVAIGDRLAVIEAMKMEHRILALSNATVAAIKVAPGDLLAEGAVLIELQPESES
jgi:3-methylcrotonyl-CoA carboxylase alpha subunit